MCLVSELLEDKLTKAEGGLLCHSDWSADIGGNGPSGPSAGCCLVPNDGDYCRGSARERSNSLSFTLVSHALSL
jgi:hypothetical protein